MSLTTIADHPGHVRPEQAPRKNARPGIVVASDDMCGAGRIGNYLKAMPGNPRHDVLFVSHQLAGKPRRAIQTHWPKGGYVDLGGEHLQIRAGIRTLIDFSAHADQKDLLSFVRRARVKRKEVRLVHGDAEARSVLAGMLRARQKVLRVVIPQAGTRVLSADLKPRRGRISGFPKPSRQ